LIIEVDGDVHLEAEQLERDRVRTEQLAAYGYRVLRFSNDAVLNHPEAVIARIRDGLASLGAQRDALAEG
jgi:very-short-patch-repair endonuclease